MTVGCPYYKLYGSYVTIKSDEKLLCLASPEKAAWRRSRRRKTWLKSARKKTKRSQLLIESWRQTQRMKCAGKWHWCVSVWTLVMRVGFLFFSPSSFRFFPVQGLQESQESSDDSPNAAVMRPSPGFCGQTCPSAPSKGKWGSALKGYIYPTLSRQLVSSRTRLTNFLGNQGLIDGTFNPIACSSSHTWALPKLGDSVSCEGLALLPRRAPRQWMKPKRATIVNTSH